MGIEHVYADRIEEAFQRDLHNPVAAPGPASFAAWSTIGAGIKAIPGAALETAGSASDLIAAEGRARERTLQAERAANPDRLQNLDGEKQRRAENDAAFEAAGRAARRKADEFAPNPETAHTADKVVHGLVRGVGKAVGDVATLGPVAGPVVFGADEGNTTYQRLKEQGVDPKTAAKVGTVTGVISGVTAAIPGVGSTVAKTIGLGVATGPAAFIAQEKLTRDILQRADYSDLAAQHDPYDPLGLALSAVLPLAVGGVHVRGLGKRAAQVKAGGVALEQMAPAERQALKYNAPQLDAYAAQAAEREGVPEAILLAVKNAGEKSNPDQTSQKGAQGVMQFMPSTAKEIGVADPRDPLQSIDGAAKYLRKLHDAYGSWDAAVAHYNGGGAQAAIVRGGGKPTFPETAAYLERVQKYAAEHAATKGAGDPAVVDAARVKVTDDAFMRSMPSHPEARTEVLQATDHLAAGRRPVVDPLEIEGRFALKLQDHEAAVREYATRPDSEGGKVLNTDVARELSPDYLADRTRSADVHEPASAFVKRLYAEKLADMPPGGQVMFTSGGTGAGKTSAIAAVPEVAAMKADADIIYDTNMNTLGSAVQKIEQALEAGASVRIVHVQRDPVEALVSGALPRAMRQEREFGTGRTVPLVEHARTHRGAAEVIQQLAEKYKDNPQVDIQVIDNTRGKGGQQRSDLGFVRGFDYNGIEGRLHAALEKQYDAGAVSEAVFAATKGDAGPRVRSPVRGDDGAGPAREDQGPAGSPGLPSASAVAIKPEAPASGEAPSLDSQRVARLAIETPDLKVRLPGSDETVTVAAALERAKAEAAFEKQESDLLKAALDCAMSFG